MKKFTRFFRRGFKKNFGLRPSRHIEERVRQPKSKVRILAAIVLVMLFIAVLQIPHPSFYGIQKQIVLLLTSQQADWTPVLNQWAGSGIWQDSFDKYVFKQTQSDILILPVSGKIERNFNLEEQHMGIDIKTDKGALVKAAVGGEVIPFSSGPSEHAVAVRHTNDRVTIYSGLENITVKIGEIIPQGKVLGLAQDFIHFEIRLKNQPVDPLPYLTADGEL